MQKSFIAIGEVVAPIVFMVFIGYQVGNYTDKMALSIIVGIIIGFIVAMFNIWKLMKRLSCKKDE